MDLSFEQKRKIFNSYLELTEVRSKDGRVSYNFEGSKQRKKQIARELTYTGNGYVYGKYLSQCKNMIDDRGWINIKNFTEQDLRGLIESVMESFE